MEKNLKKYHNIVLAFNIMNVITTKHNLLQIDTKLRLHLKQIYPLLANPQLKFLDNVIDIVDHILLA